MFCNRGNEYGFYNVSMVYVICVDFIYKVKVLLCIFRINFLSCEVVGLGNLSIVLIF